MKHKAAMQFFAALSIRVFRKCGDIENLGVVCRRVVTDAGVNALVDAFQGLFTLSDFKFHGIGTGTGSESTSDTALGTEVETRDTGTQAEGSSTNIYKTVGEIAITGTHAITEHGIFSAASSGTLLDRSNFTAINLVSGDNLECTYELTCTAGG